MSTTSQESRNCKSEYRVDTISKDGLRWWRAADITRILQYANGPQAVIQHVRKKDRTNKEFLVEGGGPSVYINEHGLRALIMRSHKPEAEVFEEWIELKLAELKDAKVRRPRNRTQIQLLTETDLRYKTVDFIRRFYPQAIIVPAMGELQDNEPKRLDAWAKGFLSGICDILLLNPNDQHHGFGIEFKTPLGTGVVSQSQQKFLEKLEAAGFKTLISNDYDEICQEIREYFS